MRKAIASIALFTSDECPSGIHIESRKALKEQVRQNIRRRNRTNRSPLPEAIADLDLDVEIFRVKHPLVFAAAYPGNQTPVHFPNWFSETEYLAFSSSWNCRSQPQAPKPQPTAQNNLMQMMMMMMMQRMMMGSIGMDGAQGADGQLQNLQLFDCNQVRNQRGPGRPNTVPQLALDDASDALSVARLSRARRYPTIDFDEQVQSRSPIESAAPAPIESAASHALKPDAHSIDHPTTPADLYESASHHAADAAKEVLNLVAEKKKLQRDQTKAEREEAAKKKKQTPKRGNRRFNGGGVRLS